MLCALERVVLGGWRERRGALRGEQENVRRQSLGCGKHRVLYWKGCWVRGGSRLVRRGERW